MKKVILVFLVFIFLVSSVLAYDNFVSVNGTNFYLNGEPFYFAGTNAYYLWYGNIDCSSPYVNQGCVIPLLNDAKSLNLSVIRTWGFCNGVNKYGYCFQPSPGVYDEATFAHFDRVIKEASDRNLKLIIPFVNNWDDFGGMCQYVKWCNASVVSCDGTSSTHDRFYTDSCVKNLYKRYVSYFLNRVNTITGMKYKDDPTILAWELANEPRSRSDKTGITLNNWIGEMSAYIKSIDNKHLVTTGIDGGYVDKEGYSPYAWWYKGYEGQNFIANHNWSSIDYTTFHYYYSMDPAINPLVWITEHVNDSYNILRKPVVFGEFNDISNKTGKLSEWYILYENLGGNGDTFWMLADNYFSGNNDGYFVLCPEDEVCSIISNHANYMNSRGKCHSGLVSYWKFEEASGTKAYDFLGLNNGTINGATWTSGKIGKALNFDGINDYISVPDSNSLDITEQITISAWIKADSFINQYPRIVAKSGAYDFYLDSGRKLWMAVYDRYGIRKNVKGSTTLSPNTWYYVTGVYHKDRGFKLYVNGVEESLSGNIDARGYIKINTQNLIIANWPGSVRYFDGLIDEAKVWNRALTQDEITEEYKANTLVAYYKFENNVLDETGNNNGVNYGAIFTSGKIGLAANFDGVNDYVAVLDSNSLDMGDALTISAWIKADSFVNQYSRILAKNNAYDLYLDAASRKLVMAVYNQSGIRKTVKGNTVLSTNTWYHIVGTYNKASGFKLYVNGVEESLTGDTGSRGNIKVSTNPLLIGNFEGLLRYFDGKIDELVIYNRALSESEILAHYNLGVRKDYCSL